MHKLELSHKAYGSTEELTSHIHSALARKLPEVQPALCSHDGTFVIAGSGPSLPAFLGEIEQERLQGRPICAVNGAHDLLCEHGVTPNLFLSVDPRKTIVANVSRKNPDTIYLLASRCNPELFDHLADVKVVLWHSWSVDDEAKALAGHFAIGGGSTSGLRAIHVGYVLGYRRFSVYGLDSCLADDGITKRFSGEKAGRIMDIHVGAEDGQKFLANVPMAQQANEAQYLMQVFPDAHITFHGPGLLSAIWAERRRRGMAA